MARHFFYGFVVLALFSCISCADSTPELILATGAAVFDYSDENSLPQLRLAVFVQMDSEVQRADSLEMESRESGYNWRVSSPRLFKNGEKKWACYTNLQPPVNEPLPAGIYDFRYNDAAGEVASSSFIVAYPKALLTAKAGDVPNLVTGATEDIALYDKNNVLIFLGKKRSNWTNNAAILRDFNGAVTKRICLSADSNRLVCLMPEELLFEAETAKTDTEDDDSDEE